MASRTWSWFPAVLLGAAVWLSGPFAEAAGEAGSFGVVQRQVKKARDRVLPALVRVQPIIETYRGGRKVSRTGYGSGVIIGPEGYVITNYHVAGKAASCICVMANKEEVPAALVGGDPWTDIAVIRLDLKKYQGNTLTWAVLGDSSDVEEGDFVLAMGSPFAMTRTVTFGIISCRDRSLGVMGIDRYQKTGQFNTWIQIDALINPGNSGGPLVDMEGRVIGINARGGSGMGFAIPINVASDVARQLVDHGEVRRSWIGVTFQPIEKFKKSFLGDVSKGGVLVGDVDEDSPASRAGLRPGDIITRLGEETVSARFEEEVYPIAKKVADLPLGASLELEIIRNKQARTLRLVTEPLENVEGDEREFKTWGFTAKEITRSLAREMRLPDAKGVQITGVVGGSVLEKAGVGSGDILKEVGGEAVEDLEGLGGILDAVLEEGKTGLLAKVMKGGRTPKVVALDVSDLVAKASDEEQEPDKEGGDADEETGESY